MLRFVTCGRAGAGKTTLIDRVVAESRIRAGEAARVLDAQCAAFGAAGTAPGGAGLADGPTAEREQGIACGVAYRFFSTGRRHCIAADTPGREASTRDLVAGASTAHVAVILVDAREGVREQTRREACLVSLLGIRRAALAVNKLDLVGYAPDVVASIEQEFRGFARRIGLDEVACIPLSARDGDNIAAPSANTPWYDGPTLIDYLDAADIGNDSRMGPFRMPVARAENRSRIDSGRCSGRIVGGTVRRGDRVRILPSGTASTVVRVVTSGGDRAEASVDETATIELADPVAAERGDMLAAADSPAGIADQFQATLIWVDEDEMLPGRSYLLGIGAATVGATVAAPKYRVSGETFEHLAAKTLHAGEIGVCNLALDQAVPFDPYRENRETGRFILIDRLSGRHLGTGLIDFALRRSQNIHWQAIEVNKAAHAALNGHKPCVVWFTGLSGAGKSTIANLVERRLHALGRHTYLLDGDNVRHGLNKDLGFTEADRVENIRRIAEVARLMADAGLIVLVSFISPFTAERRMARALLAEGEFCEVFVDAPLAVAEQRDTKGLYKKARRGELKNFTGIDSPYEPPQHPDVSIDTTVVAPGEAAEEIVGRLRRMGVLDPP